MDVETLDGVEARKPAIEKLIFQQIRPHDVPQIARHIPDLLEKACAHTNDRFTPEAVIQACSHKVRGQEWYLWLLFDEAAVRAGDLSAGARMMAVTRLAMYPTGLKIGEIILIAGRGNSDGWVKHVDAVKAWAVREGCDRLHFIGRRGFSRVLSDNWKMVTTMFELDLEEEDGRSEQRN